jgi:hypothetical protein
MALSQICQMRTAVHGAICHEIEGGNAAIEELLLAQGVKVDY